MSDETSHVDLPGLISGETPPGQRQADLDHVRGCRDCLDELVDTTALIAELRDARRYPPVEPSEVPPLRLDRSGGTLEPPEPASKVPTSPAQQSSRHWLHSRILVGAVAAVVALVVGIVIGNQHGSTSTPAAKVLLAAVGQLPSSASGAAQMVGQGEDQSMLVTLSGLDRPPPGDHYEVWLLDTRTGRTFAVGVVSPSVTGKMAYPLPASKAVGYDTIDVSLQAPANGAKHSGVSLLRGALS